MRKIISSQRCFEEGIKLSPSLSEILSKIGSDYLSYFELKSVEYEAFLFPLKTFNSVAT